MIWFVLKIIYYLFIFLTWFDLFLKSFIHFFYPSKAVLWQIQWNVVNLLVVVLTWVGNVLVGIVQVKIVQVRIVRMGNVQVKIVQVKIVQVRIVRMGKCSGGDCPGGDCPRTQLFMSWLYIFQIYFDKYLHICVLFLLAGENAEWLKDYSLKLSWYGTCYRGLVFCVHS